MPVDSPCNTGGKNQNKNKKQLEATLHSMLTRNFENVWPFSNTWHKHWETGWRTTKFICRLGREISPGHFVSNGMGRNWLMDMNARNQHFECQSVLTYWEKHDVGVYTITNMEKGQLERAFVHVVMPWSGKQWQHLLLGSLLLICLPW
jgi:hypothetical protein